MIGSKNQKYILGALVVIAVAILSFFAGVDYQRNHTRLMLRPGMANGYSRRVPRRNMMFRRRTTATPSASITPSSPTSPFL